MYVCVEEGGGANWVRINTPLLYQQIMADVLFYFILFYIVYFIKNKIFICSGNKINSSVQNTGIPGDRGPCYI